MLLPTFLLSSLTPGTLLPPPPPSQPPRCPTNLTKCDRQPSSCAESLLNNVSLPLKEFILKMYLPSAPRGLRIRPQKHNAGYREDGEEVGGRRTTHCHRGITAEACDPRKRACTPILGADGAERSFGGSSVLCRVVAAILSATVVGPREG